MNDSCASRYRANVNEQQRQLKHYPPLWCLLAVKIKSRMLFAESWSVKKLYTSRLLTLRCKGKKSKQQ